MKWIVLISTFVTFVAFSAKAETTGGVVSICPEGSRHLTAETLIKNGVLPQGVDRSLLEMCLFEMGEWKFYKSVRKDDGMILVYFRDAPRFSFDKSSFSVLNNPADPPWLFALDRNGDGKYNELSVTNKNVDGKHVQFTDRNGDGQPDIRVDFSSKTTSVWVDGNWKEQN